MARCSFHSISFFPLCEACAGRVTMDCHSPACFQFRQNLEERLQALYGISSQRAGQYLAQVNLSTYGLNEGVQACEALFDVLEQFLVSELGERVVVNPVSSAPESDRGSPPGYAMIGRIMRCMPGDQRAFIVDGVRLGDVAEDCPVLVRVVVRWQ